MDTYSKIARAYDEQVRGELAHKPLDRALLTAFLELAGHGTVADVGCGPGHVTRFLADRHPGVIGVDLSPGMIAIARERVPDSTFSVGSMLSLPAADSSWAGAVALYSIIHLTPAERAVAFGEFARVLKPGGPLLLSFHVDSAEVAAGESTHLTEWFGSEVDVDVHFLDPVVITRELTAAGLAVQATLIRKPIAGAEFPSRRAYLTACREPASEF
ncbi:class I SAM-dependent methyltransferase [Actinoplanes friuliensis]|uniref:Methyltransferase n=1 Tax=Actinoplanes friuliensis DSM 7358 TaxID=1246995 RepID=U5W6Y0_9ACTN|nr:class I SAM-dependent methyltransferase [Actinoplanes friuliensis]AGZ43740.1 methyltransferase [Actinoplanes friuliensis DSM 7358]